MMKIYIAFFTLLSILVVISTNVYADCADGTYSCDNGAVGLSHNCWHGPSWKPFVPIGECKYCGNTCPKIPKITKLPHKALASINVLTTGQKNNCRSILEKDVPDGCSNDFLKDPASKAFRNIFDDTACKEHDICFATPGKTQIQCNDEFIKNMGWVCKDYYYEQANGNVGLIALNAVQLAACEAAAVTWTAVVSAASKFGQTHIDGEAKCDLDFEVDGIVIENKGAFSAMVQIKWADGSLDRSKAFPNPSKESYKLENHSIPPSSKVWVQAGVVGAAVFINGLETAKNQLTYKPGINKTAHFTLYGPTWNWSIVLDSIESK